MVDFTTQFFPGWITYVSASIWTAALTSTALTGIFIVAGWWFSSIKKRKKSYLPTSSKTEQLPVNYDELLTAITNKNGQMQALLFAASSIKDLPVNIPINVAVRLAKHHKCLLIDLDLKRNAVARVFDLEMDDSNGTAKSSSYATPLENLFIWPARNFEKLRHMNLRSLLEGAVKKYDYVLIYAPYLTTLADRRQVAACSRQAIAFTGRNGSQLLQLLEQCNCKVVRQV